MQPLRVHFIEDMRLAGLAARTQEASVRAVEQMVRALGKPPRQITEEDLRAYSSP